MCNALSGIQPTRAAPHWLTARTRMVVEYLVARCGNETCMVFQCLQKTKSAKFSCKVCSTKQSIRKVRNVGAFHYLLTLLTRAQIYGQSYKAKDLRPLVQEYNLVEGKRRAKAERARDVLAAHFDDSRATNTSFHEQVEEAAQDNIWQDFEVGEGLPEEEPCGSSASVVIRDSSAPLQPRRLRKRQATTDVEAGIPRRQRKRSAWQSLSATSDNSTAAMNRNSVPASVRGCRSSAMSPPVDAPVRGHVGATAVPTTIPPAPKPVHRNSRIYQQMQEAEKDNIWTSFTRESGDSPVKDDKEAIVESPQHTECQRPLTEDRLDLGFHRPQFEGADEY